MGEAAVGGAMHELSVALAIHRACRQAPELHGGRLKAVRIALGELAGVDPTLLQHAWPAAIAGGPDDSAKLVIDWYPAQQVCPACGVIPERQPGSWLRICPKCESPLKVDDAGHMDIVQMEIIDDVSAATLE